MVPAALAAEVSSRLDIHTIGIGAGVNCDGQVLVCNDLLGFDSSFKPRFVKRFAELENPMIEAVSAYAKEVREGVFPTEKHAFHSKRGPRKVAKIY